MARADTILTSSTTVVERIRRTYGREAAIVAPPITLGTAPAAPPADLPPFATDGRPWLLCVSRLRPYKHVDAVVDAFAQLPDLGLMVVGEGPDRDALVARAGANVVVRSSLPDEELRGLYGHAAGVVAASNEDFGLTPLEAAAFGRPAVALRGGGFLDTIVEGQTGVFVDAPSAAAIAAGVRQLVDRRWDADRLRAHAATYDEASFAAALQAVVRGER